jgi:peptidoglycan/LPS O-acetylase OafA/YrhL
VSYGLAAAVFIASYLARSIFPNLMPLRGLSAVSYPLYVVHGVLGYVAMRIMIDLVVLSEAAFVLAFWLAIAISSGLHVLIERPTQRMGRIARPRHAQEISANK